MGALTDKSGAGQHGRVTSLNDTLPVETERILITDVMLSRLQADLRRLHSRDC